MKEGFVIILAAVVVGSVVGLYLPQANQPPEPLTPLPESVRLPDSEPAAQSEPGNTAAPKPVADASSSQTPPSPNSRVQTDDEFEGPVIITTSSILGYKPKPYKPVTVRRPRSQSRPPSSQGGGRVIKKKVC